MITIALIIGLYSYFIFFLGIFSRLYSVTIHISVIVLLTIVIVTTIYKKYIILNLIRDLKYLIRIPGQAGNEKFVYFLFVLLVVQILINSIGVFGPELGFDALWYHLTLPKLYLLYHSIFHIPGGLLYYSDMPKLGEMLYIAGLSFGERIPKLIHFSFGILTIYLLYKTLRKFVSPLVSLIGVLMFYTSLVVGWESTSSYIDLIRTFYELMGLWLFVQWQEKKEQHLLLLSAVMIGFAITTKLLALGSVVLFLFLIIYDGIITNGKKLILKYVLIFLCVALVIPLPWFIFSFSNTGNPLYPFFTSLYSITPQANIFSPLTMVKEFSTLFLFSSDPISPLYIIFLPLILLYYPYQKLPYKTISIYAFLALVIWYITPRTGGGRFILPYLPVMSMVAAISMVSVINQQIYRYMIIAVVSFVALTAIVYRGGANTKYIPYILGKESKTTFLKSNLNFNYGDFYDVDGFFKKTITNNDRVLLYGFHNLYYIDFPFIDSSWIKKGNTFNYIAVQHSSLPERFMRWEKIYMNQTTGVSVYTNEKKMKKY